MGTSILLCSFMVISVMEFASTMHVQEENSLPMEAPKVNVEFYMESLCPDCMQMFLNSIYPAYHTLKDIMNLEFIPYGNADETQSGNGTWKFTCQHGSAECTGNLIENCMLHFVQDMKTQVEYMYCLESNSPATSGEMCARKLKLSGIWHKISSCSTSSMGNKLMHMAAVKTNQLKPAHQWVPWILVNGEHSQSVDTATYQVFKETICAKYKGKRPAVCSKSPRRCLKTA
ncbi:IFI30 (predicted) [Pycnogonum litorale]